MPQTKPRNAGFGATSWVTTPTGADPCPKCGDMSYTHPREFGPEEIKGYCFKCNRWIRPSLESDD